MSPFPTRVDTCADLLPFTCAQDPAQFYEGYIAAVARRDVQAVLDGLGAKYGRALRAARAKARFEALFELWCATYPQQVVVVAWCIDRDTAALETRAETGGEPLAGRAHLVLDGERWRVDSERCADGRTRMPINRLSPCGET